MVGDYTAPEQGVGDGQVIQEGQVSSNTSQEGNLIYAYKPLKISILPKNFFLMLPLDSDRKYFLPVTYGAYVHCENYESNSGKSWYKCYMNGELKERGFYTVYKKGFRKITLYYDETEEAERILNSVNGKNNLVVYERNAEKKEISITIWKNYKKFPTIMLPLLTKQGYLYVLPFTAINGVELRLDNDLKITTKAEIYDHVLEFDNEVKLVPLNVHDYTGIGYILLPSVSTAVKITSPDYPEIKYELDGSHYYLFVHPAYFCTKHQSSD